MHTLLVVTHVISMILSMGLMAGAIGLGLFGKNAAAKTATVAYILSVAGFTSGLILLMGAPLTIECALLAGYLAIATVLYRYGFALGNPADARFIRQL
jgi:ABC-type uncharacterized transport system ATPase subunit